jgi:hypothetical protein
VNENVDPAPGALVTLTRSPCASTRRHDERGCERSRDAVAGPLRGARVHGRAHERGAADERPSRRA